LCAYVVDSDEGDEEEMAPMPPPAATNTFPAAAEVDENEDVKVELAPQMLLVASNDISLPVPPTFAPTAPVTSWSGASDAYDVEEDEEELAAPPPRHVVVCY
jgi:hypothetical protein